MTKHGMTLDQLLEKIHELKSKGIPGDTKVTIAALNNNQESGFLSPVSAIASASVSKTDFEKGYSLCKKVSSRGVPVLQLLSVD